MCLPPLSGFLDGQRSYFLTSDIDEFNAHRLRFGDMIRTGDIDSGVPDLCAIPAAQPRAPAACDRAAQERA